MSKDVPFKVWPFVLLAIIAVTVIFLNFHNRKWPEVTIHLREKNLKMLVADTYAHEFEGWGKKTDMNGYDGMIFVFSYRAPHAMVMRAVQFPLDIVWVDGDTIVDMAPNVQPQPGLSESQLTQYQPRVPDTTVLEFRAGLIEQLGLKIGDTIVTVR